MKNGRPRPTLPYQGAAIYASADKQFSRPMTGHTPRKLPFFNAISRIIAVHAQFPYTRLNNITSIRKNVKQFFRKNHKLFRYFSYILDSYFLQAGWRKMQKTPGVRES